MASSITSARCGSMGSAMSTLRRLRLRLTPKYSSPSHRAERKAPRLGKRLEESIYCKTGSSINQTRSPNPVSIGSHLFSLAACLSRIRVFFIDRKSNTSIFLPENRGKTLGEGTCHHARNHASKIGRHAASPANIITLPEPESPHHVGGRLGKAVPPTRSQ